MEATTPPKTTKRLTQESAITLWSEIEDLLAVERVSLRADRVGYRESQEWGVEEGTRYYEIVIAGEIDGTTLSRIQAAAASYERNVVLSSGTLTIR